MTTLKNFIAEVSNGIARNAHFAVQINMPRVLTNQPLLNTNIQKILMFCEGTTLPGINLSTMPIRSFGESREVPYEKMYTPISMNFIVDYNLIVKVFFDMWLDKIQGTNTRLYEYPANYSTTIDIYVYDVQNTKRYVVRLYDAYPKTIHANNLDYQNRDAMRLNVDFTYKYYATGAMDSGIQREHTFGGLPSTYLSDFISFQAALSSAEYAFRQTVENAGTSIGRGLMMY